MSILLRLFVGVAFAGGLGDDAADHARAAQRRHAQELGRPQIVEKRLGVTLVDEPPASRRRAHRRASARRPAPPRRPGCRRATRSTPSAARPRRRHARRAGRPVASRRSHVHAPAATRHAAPAAGPVVPARSAATSPSAMPTHPVCGHRRGLRRSSARWRSSSQRREVLPGIPLRQGRHLRRERHPPAALRPRAARAAEPLRHARHQRRHQPARAGLAALETASRPSSGQSDPGADQGGARRSRWRCIVSWQLTLFIIVFVPLMARR